MEIPKATLEEDGQRSSTSMSGKGQSRHSVVEGVEGGTDDYAANETVGVEMIETTLETNDENDGDGSLSPKGPKHFHAVSTTVTSLKVDIDKMADDYWNPEKEHIQIYYDQGTGDQLKSQCATDL